MVHQELWGDSYSQTKVIKNLLNSHIFCLYAEPNQMRYLLAGFRNVAESPGGAGLQQHQPQQQEQLQLRQQQFTEAMRDIQIRYRTLLTTQMYGGLPQGSQRRFLMIIRFVVPFHHAIVLVYLRFIRGSGQTDPEQRKAIRELMHLAFGIYRDEGDGAIGRVAWPLFIAALETDDVIHRAWIMERFRALSARGENHNRTRQALGVALSE